MQKREWRQGNIRVTVKNRQSGMFKHILLLQVLHVGRTGLLMEMKIEISKMYRLQG